MADIFPSNLSEIYQDPKFLAELKVFKSLQATLPQDAKIYCQCHFFKKGYDGNKTEGECDMIVLLPNEGIIFLEIKGGLIGYKAKDQQFTSTRRDTNETFPIKNPVTQARSAQINIIDLFTTLEILSLLIETFFKKFDFSMNFVRIFFSEA